jgi:hypothetical protein
VLPPTDRLDPHTLRGLDDLKTQIRLCARNWNGGYAQNRLAAIHIKQWRFLHTPKLGLASGNVTIYDKFQNNGIMSNLVCWLPDELLPELGLVAMVFYTVINPRFAILLLRYGYASASFAEGTWIRPAKKV